MSVAAASRGFQEGGMKEQAVLNIDETYERWSTFEEPDGMDATALYNEHGEALSRYSSDES